MEQTALFFQFRATNSYRHYPFNFEVNRVIVLFQKNKIFGEEPYELVIESVDFFNFHGCFVKGIVLEIKRG